MIHPLIIFTGILLLVDALLILYYHSIWDQIPVSGDAFDLTMPSRNVLVLVIIPARNEFLSIGNCLDHFSISLTRKEFTEIIVVDDHSTDGTAAIVLEHKLNSKLLKLSDFSSDNLNSYKKKAIETGIAHSSGELIICTDADCTMGPHWIKTLVSAYNKENLQFIAAPVKISTDRSWLSVFQALDFISLQGITGAAVYKNLYPMCNGANLAYTKSAFAAVKGFTDIDHIASGDDMLLMKKIQSAFPGKSGYIKDQRAIVSTESCGKYESIFQSAYQMGK